MTEVVAALIQDGGKWLIGQRPVHKARGLHWEFVGGKVEPGETQAQALARECQEELGIAVQVGKVRAEVTYAYPDVTVHLTLLEATITGGVPQAREHNAICWVTPAEVNRYPLCPADTLLLHRLSGGVCHDLR